MTLSAGSRGRSIQVVGHRGAAGVAPENTLPSFEAAWDAGVAWVETDVRLTSDGVPVLLHDATLDRTTTGQGAVGEVTEEELQRLDAGIHFAPAFAGTRVPRLAELLTAAAGRSALLIELKTEPERADLLIRQVLKVIDTQGARDSLRLISFEADLLARVSGAGNSGPLATGLIASTAAGLVETSLRLGCAAVHPRLSALSPELVAEARAAGLRINTWTANTADQVRRAVDLGADEITTDFPALAREVLEAAG